MVNIDKIPSKYKDDVIVAFNYGSQVYGTATEQSDHDIVVVVTNNHDLSALPNEMDEISVDNYDYHIVTDKVFRQMINDYNILAIEGMFLPEEHYLSKEKFDSIYGGYVFDDKWKLRQTISKIAENAYAKCHKKLTVEKDFDEYRGKKSIFHSIRILLFGKQLASDYKITDYTCANAYWDEIKVMGPDWNDYKVKYKPLLNKLRTEFVALCPKPLNG